MEKSDEIADRAAKPVRKDWISTKNYPLLWEAQNQFIFMFRVI